MNPRVTRAHLGNIDPCPIIGWDGEPCGAYTPHGMPFSICGPHARQVFDHVNQFIEGVAQQPMFRMSLGLDMLADSRRAAAAYKPPPDEVVYYVQIGDHIKVGYTAHLPTRLKSYPPTRRLLATEPGNPSLETRRHREFRHLLHAGREWFNPGPDLMAHINDLRAAQGAAPIRLAA